MARHKLDIQKRQHRERAQPLHRQKLGLLEKHSDYVQRAKDYNSKKDRIKKLRLKASLKNQDEFYFKMINSKTVNGLHYTFNKSNPPLDNQLVKLLKTQDFNYVKTCRAIEENKIIKLKERLGSMVTILEGECPSTRTDLNEEIISLINESTAATGAKNADSSHQADTRSGPSESMKTGKKIVYVDSVEEVKNFDLSSLGKKPKKKKNKLTETTSPETANTITRSAENDQAEAMAGPAEPKGTGIVNLFVGGKKNKAKLTDATSPTILNKSTKNQISIKEFSDIGAQSTDDQETHMKRLMRELKSRITRLRVLQTAERELELKKSLMGKGPKFLKFGSSDKPKQKGLINGRDLSWYDKLDRNQLIEEDLERERAEQLNKGIKTGAKVWKWKQERKK